MKQTVEEAAKEARMTSAETLTIYGTHTSLDDFTYLSHDEIAESAFIKGADWQSKQSPWISVKGRLPDEMRTSSFYVNMVRFLTAHIATMYGSAWMVISMTRTKVTQFTLQ